MSEYGVPCNVSHTDCHIWTQLEQGHLRCRPMRPVTAFLLASMGLRPPPQRSYGPRETLRRIGSR